jgi:hypothetical protein
MRAGVGGALRHYLASSTREVYSNFASARGGGMTAIPLAIKFPEGIHPAFAEAARAGAGAVIIISDAATISHRNQLGDAGIKYKLPTIFSNRA